MKFKAVQAVMVKGDRVERGQVVDIAPELASSIGTMYLTPIESEKQEAPVVVEVSLDTLTRQELIEKAKSLGLASHGTKAELLERISLSIE